MAGDDLTDDVRNDPRTYCNHFGEAVKVVENAGDADDSNIGKVQLTMVTGSKVRGNYYCYALDQFKYLELLLKAKADKLDKNLLEKIKTNLGENLCEFKELHNFVKLKDIIHDKIIDTKIIKGGDCFDDDHDDNGDIIENLSGKDILGTGKNIIWEELKQNI